MKNPNNIKRTIRHAKLMTLAGFKIDRKLCLSNKHCSYLPTRNLIYWINEDGIRVTLSDNEQISLKNLVSRVKRQAEFLVKQKAEIIFG